MYKHIVRENFMCTRLLLASFLVAAVNVVCAAPITIQKPSLKEGCYQIGSANELFGFAAIVNGTDGMDRNSNACGKLVSDIIIRNDVVPGEGAFEENESFWTPIMNFGGTFDGNNKNIQGLYFRDDTVSEIGLFGSVVGGSSDKPVEIKNVRISGSYFKGKSNVGVVGLVSGTLSISKVYNVGSSSGQENVGGLIGRVDSTSFVKISNSYNGGPILGYTSSIGGWVGLAEGNVSVTNSYNLGSVYGHSYTGGLVGNSLKVVVLDNVFNSGAVEGSNHVGGLVGFGRSVVVSNSYNSASIKGKENVGGLVGDAYALTMTNSFNSGNVSSQLIVGGIVGGVGHGMVLSNVYNSGEIRCESISGGLVGFVDYADNGDKYVVANSYNVGKVGPAETFIGGIFGSKVENVEVSVKNSFSKERYSENQDGTVMTDVEFANGTVYEKLRNFNDENADGGAWLQTLQKDSIPKLSTITVKEFDDVDGSVVQIAFTKPTAPGFRVDVENQQLSIFGASVGSAYVLSDLRGRRLSAGRVNMTNFVLDLPHLGAYVLRIGGRTQMVKSR